MRVALHLAAPSTYDGALTCLRRVCVRVTPYPDASALCAGLATGPLPDVVVTGLRDARGRPVAAVVGQLCARFPTVPVVAYGVPAPSLAGDIVEATRLGLAAAALHGVDDLVAVLRRIVADAAPCRVADAALALVDPRLGPTTRPIVGYCLIHARTAPAVEQVATALGVTRKTVAARLAAEGLPPASALIGWGRVLLAARWLEDPGRSAERVAHALGLGDGTGLRHLLARYTGLRAGEVRAAGGLAGVLPLFAAAFDAAPNDRREVRRSIRCAVRGVLLWLAASADWDVALVAVLTG